MAKRKTIENFTAITLVLIFGSLAAFAALWENRRSDKSGGWSRFHQSFSRRNGEAVYSRHFDLELWC